MMLSPTRAAQTLVFSLGLGWCGAVQAIEPQHLPVQTILVDGAPVIVEIADEPAERQQGLMAREPLQVDHGMLFVYPDQRGRSFWMKNTISPLSIAFISKDGVIIRIADMQPLDLSGVPSGAAVMYALEMNQGWFSAHGVSVGERIEGLPGPAAE